MHILSFDEQKKKCFQVLHWTKIYKEVIFFHVIRLKLLKLLPSGQYTFIDLHVCLLLLFTYLIDSCISFTLHVFYVLSL